MIVGWQLARTAGFPTTQCASLQASDATYSCALHKLKHGLYPERTSHPAFFLRTHLIKSLGTPERPCFLIIEGHCKVSMRIKCHESMNGLYTI